jgi:hypothetical protein
VTAAHHIVVRAETQFPEVPLFKPRRAHVPRDGNVVAVFGIKGCGKSTVVYRALAWDVVADGRRAVIYDGSGDLSKYLASGGVWGRPFIPLRWCAQVGSASEAWEAIASDVRVVILNGRRHGLQAMADAWVDVMDSDTKQRNQGLVGVCDEAEFVFPNPGPTGGPRFSICKLVRNRQQTIYFAGHRPQKAAPLLRMQTDEVLLFRADSELFVKNGTKEWGNSKLFERVETLRPFEYLYRPPWADPHASLALHDARTGPIPWRSDHGRR